MISDTVHNLVFKNFFSTIYFFLKFLFFSLINLYQNIFFLSFTTKFQSLHGILNKNVLWKFCACYVCNIDRSCLSNSFKSSLWRNTGLFSFSLLCFWQFQLVLLSEGLFKPLLIKSVLLHFALALLGKKLIH